MSMKAQSKYRHIFGTPAKPEKCYTGLRIMNSAWDSNSMAASATLLAIPSQGGGGPVIITPHSRTGKQAENFSAAGHKGNVLDMAFSPFDDNMLATGSDDTTVAIWKFPETGITENWHSDKILTTLNGHSKKVGVVRWNPTADGVLATSSIDKTIKIWDVETGAEKFSVEDFPDYPTSMTWSWDGAILAAVTKKKELNLIDPREGAIMNTASSHQGAKSQRCVWLGDKNLIFTFGFSKMSEREIAVWDPKKMDKPVFKDALDVASGVLMPLYDPDLHVMYLGGKGDGNIRYFEIQEGGTPFFLNSFSSGAPQAGLAMKPKRSVDVMNTEVGMLFKLEKAQVTPVSMVLPRKGGQFHADAFPPTQAGVPAVSGASWCEEGATATPVMKSQKPGDTGVMAGSAVAKKSGMAARVEELEAEVASLKAQLAAALGGAPAPAAAAAPAAEPAAEPAAAAPAADDDDDEPAE